MFTEIPAPMRQRMQYLEKLDAQDRQDGTERLKRLRQIPPETGKFLALMAASVPNKGEFLEIGTSAGYSTMWLSLAMKEQQAKLKTFEIMPEKAALARETIKQADIASYVDLIEGDFLKQYQTKTGISFCFLDCEKEIYLDCFNKLADQLLPGGLLIADNAINHYENIKEMIEKAQADIRFDTLIVPIGKGEFICRRKS